VVGVDAYPLEFDGLLIDRFEPAGGDDLGQLADEEVTCSVEVDGGEVSEIPLVRRVLNELDRCRPKRGLIMVTLTVYRRSPPPVTAIGGKRRE
jgi:hypothetical protein